MTLQEQQDRVFGTLARLWPACQLVEHGPMLTLYDAFGGAAEVRVHWQHGGMAVTVSSGPMFVRFDAVALKIKRTGDIVEMWDGHRAVALTP